MRANGSRVEWSGSTDRPNATPRHPRPSRTPTPPCGRGCVSTRASIPAGVTDAPTTTPAVRAGPVNHKKIQRLWREEGLRVVVKRRRKRVGFSTVPPVPSATGPNMVWAIDFQFDSTSDGRPVKILSVVDEHTRECLGGLVERSITGEVLATELNRITATRGGGGPAVLRLDNGPEMIAAALAEWAGTRTGMLFIHPGSRGATPSSSPSTVACATNASTSTCSGP